MTAVDPGIRPSGGLAGLEAVFERCRAEDRAALIGYLPVGYPDVPGSIRAMRTLVEAGCDIVEIGVPYSDPLMDGPTIQRAVEAALAGGTRVADTFAAVRAVHETGAAAVVMLSWNLVLRRGVATFAQELAQAGGSGLITPDVIPEESAEWIDQARALGLSSTYLVAPSSTPERLATVTAATTGFVYATAVMGVTGVRASVGDAAQGLVERTRQHTDLPVCVGLGVSTRAQAAEIGRYADGVIVGSALVRCLIDGVAAGDPEQGLAQLSRLVGELAQGVREARG